MEEAREKKAKAAPDLGASAEERKDSITATKPEDFIPARPANQLFAPGRK